MAKKPKAKKKKVTTKPKAVVTKASKKIASKAPKTKAAKRSKSKSPAQKKIVAPGITLNKVLPGFGVKERTKGLRMSEIMKFTPLHPDDHNARFVFTATSHNGKQFPKFGRYKGRVAVFFKTLTRDQQADSPRLHTQLLYARDPDYEGALIDCPQVVFSCDCQRFLFMYEYALWKRGAAELRFGNGEPPVKTNPRMRPGCCKHFKRVYVFMKSNKK
jgi:hypothetical protein